MNSQDIGSGRLLVGHPVPVENTKGNHHVSLEKIATACMTNLGCG